jgi:integrase
VDRQKLRETINQLQPFRGKPRTFGQLCQHYIEHELRIDQANSARPKEFPTIETYERHLIKRIIPRWGDLAPLAIKSTEIEKWFLELRKGNVQKKVKPFADPTVDKIRRIMNLVYMHGQRHEFLPRQQEGNPMNWVSQRTTSNYTAVPMTPKQAFEILLNISEPRRTLTLSDAATALRVSELLALTWADLDFVVWSCT